MTRNICTTILIVKRLIFILGQATSSGELGGTETGQKGESVETKVTTTLKGNKGERINKALAKVEEKKKKRVQRRNQVRMDSFPLVAMKCTSPLNPVCGVATVFNNQICCMSWEHFSLHHRDSSEDGSSLFYPFKGDDLVLASIMIYGTRGWPN